MRNIYTQLLVITLITSPVKLYAQYDLTVNNLPVDSAMHIIWKETGYKYYFNCSVHWIRHARRVSISEKNATLRQLLQKVFRGTDLTFRIKGKYVEILVKNIVGTVTNHKGDPLQGITVNIKGTGQFTATDPNGNFMLKSDSSEVLLVFTGVATDSGSKKISDRKPVLIALNVKITHLPETYKVANIGPPERATGSYSFQEGLLLNRASVYAIAGLEGSNHLLFAKDPYNDNRVRTTLRGLSTLFGNSNPLIVIDEWLYEGNPATLPLNIDDIESITLLKDAAATANYGTRAGNGVIVVTTKKGRRTPGYTIQLNNTVTIGNIPNQFYQPVMSSRDYVNMELLLFDQGFYGGFKNPAKVFSPVTELLIQRKNGQVSSAAADMLLDYYRQYDNRYDQTTYFYQRPVNQHHSISLNGNSDKHSYYFSISSDRNRYSFLNSKQDRTILLSSYQVKPYKGMEARASIQYLENDLKNNEQAPFIRWIYAPLADENHNALAIPKDIRQGYKDTAGKGALLDWDYRPVDEVRKQNSISTLTSVRINGQIAYHFLNHFTARLLHQFTDDNTMQTNLMTPDMYLPRNYINSFTQMTATGFQRIIPYGGILDVGQARLYSKNSRLLLDYNHAWADHAVTALGGIETRRSKESFTSGRRYGYYSDRLDSPPLDYQTEFPQFYNVNVKKRIPSNNLPYFATNNYQCVFFNTLYTYRNRYFLSASVRKDETKLFGSDNNINAIPLWSTGFAWIISKEKFKWTKWLSFLKIRGSLGLSSNAIKSTWPLTTIAGGDLNVYNAPVIPGAVINLRDAGWEKVRMWNLGLDFTWANNRIDGSIDYYRKKATDLLATMPGDSSSNGLYLTRNVAAMKGTGVELNLTIQNIKGPLFKWFTKLMASYNRQIVTRYPHIADQSTDYLDPEFNIPVEGRPPLGVFSLKWRGLNAENGHPMGELNGQPSGDYYSLTNATPVNEMVYNGPGLPVFFGNMQHELAYKNWVFSFNVIWKTGHYFRDNSVNYSDAANGRSLGHADYTKRWQQPGDEKYTQVPSANFSNVSRDIFYKYAEILVKKADHVRLQYVQIAYDHTRKSTSPFPFKSARLFIQLSNPGFIYKAANTDPEYVNGIPPGKSWTIGLSVELDKEKSKETK